MSAATRPRKPRLLVLLLVLAAASTLALGGAELAVRALSGEPRVLGAIGFETADGEPVADYVEGVKRGLIVPVPGAKPRQRFMFKPGLRFFITYADNDVLGRAWLDPRGRVANRINSAGVRDREELTGPKPDGQRRLVCVGDSFTFGWGIPEEQNWVRMLEDRLRDGGDDVRTVKILGGGVNDSEVYPGMIFKQDALTTIRTVKDAKIAVYSCPFDIQVRMSISFHFKIDMYKKNCEVVLSFFVLALMM